MQPWTHLRSCLTIMLASSSLTIGSTRLHAEEAQPAATADVVATLKQMVGCFQVHFTYIEDGAHDAIYPPVYERADLVNESPLTIQRTLVLGQTEQLHWSEVWTEVLAGQWQQEVTGPYGDFRYRCTAPWNLNQWSCIAKGAAKPRRDADRPYATIDRDNTLQLNAKRWVQMETNRKVTADGKLYSVEAGWNQYDLVDPKLCVPSP
ncbi:MAG: hypothetical protein NTZ90_06255 [Proteobacteria bacterium]|nr:hypothetical protein [Pseudomonadota bacterium]